MDVIQKKILSHLPERFAKGALKRLSVGDTNYNFLLECADGRYFLRCGRDNAYQLGINRWAELKILNLAQAHEVAPEVIYAEPASGILVYNWHDDFINPQLLSRDEQILLIAQLARTIHELPIPDIGPMDLAQHCTSYFDQISTPPNWLFKLQKVMLKDYKNLNYQPTCICHHDLHFANIQQNPIRVIDWEYASVGDPMYELAMIVQMNHYDEDTIKLLLHHYNESAEVENFKKIKKMLPMVDYTCLLWAMLRYKDNPHDPHLLELPAIRKRIEAQWL